MALGAGRRLRGETWFFSVDDARKVERFALAMLLHLLARPL